MPKRSDILLIEDIIENAENVFGFIGNDSYEDFIGNKMKLYAVIRAFEIIGEAAKSVSEKTRKKYPTIEWREIIRFQEHPDASLFWCGEQNTLVRYSKRFAL